MLHSTIGNVEVAITELKTKGLVGNGFTEFEIKGWNSSGPNNPKNFGKSYSE